MKKVVLLFFLLFCISISSQKKRDTLPKPKWKIHGRFAFIFNQSSFSNWASGGENTVAGNINVNYDFNYKKNSINWDTRIISGYGLSHIGDKGYRKTDDRFELNSLFGLKTSAYWFFSFITNFRTQYTKGFDYRNEPKQLVSEFFAPAYLTFGPGMLWKKSDDLSLNIAPATARYTIVNDFFSGKFGVDEGRNTAFSLGFNLSGYYKFSVMDNIEMENVFTLYTDYLANVGNIDVDYQINIRFKVNKNINMQMTFHTIIDDNSSSKIQFRQLFGLGVNYSFHEKVTYQ
ncbi:MULTISPECIES: DUF3078 domain-containing protein [unclassified Polaribacter]|uniref:DUF3078 domain-containing protein n=1 Tax=unclassified Polaribacter TaxID=196858 RepID=UPI0011BFCA0A|nr:MULTISPECIES: DUF3078 domain-containing protein [unclassified Polaribacter]TXD51346.1 DUF3078 domain-containing protein [Polaribacter sp. IC063]TXD61981.1 DUF3078 domain-containing protein [Polaribacter sp. IC066]